MRRLRLLVSAAALIGMLVAVDAFPGVAQAHGPLAPVASNYEARVNSIPARLDAKVVDGDQRMWLRAVPNETVVVLDYRGSPYLRFSRSGVAVNRNSAMYYLNQTPVPASVPSNLTPRTPPQWQRVSGAHDYLWHDGRLHALANVALSPGVSYVGRWTIPVLVNGSLESISGGVWHAGSPSIAWFWPIVVLLVCILAARRLRRPRLDTLVARAIALLALVAIAVAALGRGLHGRPTVSVLQLLEPAVVLAIVLWALQRVLFGRPRYFPFFVVAVVAVWEGIELAPTLVNGFVLIALPAFVARAASVVCLGCGAGLVLSALRLADLEPPSRSADIELGVDDSAAKSLA